LLERSFVQGSLAQGALSEASSQTERTRKGLSTPGQHFSWAVDFSKAASVTAPDAALKHNNSSNNNSSSSSRKYGA